MKVNDEYQSSRNIDTNGIFNLLKLFIKLYLRTIIFTVSYVLHVILMICAFQIFTPLTRTLPTVRTCTTHRFVFFRSTIAWVWTRVRQFTSSIRTTIGFTIQQCITRTSNGFLC